MSKVTKNVTYVKRSNYILECFKRRLLVLNFFSRCMNPEFQVQLRIFIFFFSDSHHLHLKFPGFRKMFVLAEHAAFSLSILCLGYVIFNLKWKLNSLEDNVVVYQHPIFFFIIQKDQLFRLYMIAAHLN